MTYTLHQGDCLEVLRTLPDASVDAVVCDPPYGLSFMGKRWDYDVPSVDVWVECLRVLKPGGHLLAFAGTRTQHRMAVRIEDAGFEIRDLIAWVYSQGFPKSLNLKGDRKGWGTALKPSLEPVTVARKPLDGTVAENVLAHGTGALNVDGCRVGTEEMTKTKSTGEVASQNMAMAGANYRREEAGTATGRWPANLIHDGSEEVVRLFPECDGVVGACHDPRGSLGFHGGAGGAYRKGEPDTGSAARFFYQAKAGGDDDRHAGCSGLFWQGAATVAGWSPIDRSEWERRTIENERARKAHLPPPYLISRGSIHTTVKPTDLMRYLCRLVTPPSGVVLDPFTGSGSTGRGAILEGFRFIGIEREPEYVAIARARIEDAVGTRRAETAQGSLPL